MLNTRTGFASGTLWDMADKAANITFIGAGGKTTCLTRLAQEVTTAKRAAVLTTTTKVYPFCSIAPWQSSSLPPPSDYQSPCFWYASCEEGSGKWAGIAWQTLDRVFELENKAGNVDRVWLVEGDGARCRGLKCWAGHEPQIPLNTRCAVLVINGRLWGQTLRAPDVHRPELCPELIGRVWSEESFWTYVTNSPVFYPEYSHLAWVVFCNQVVSDPLAESILAAQGGVWQRAKGAVGKLSLPSQLRLAAGDAGEGKIQWYDLW